MGIFLVCSRCLQIKTEAKIKTEIKLNDLACSARCYTRCLVFFSSCDDKKANNVKTVYSVNKIYCKQQLYGNEHS